ICSQRSASVAVVRLAHLARTTAVDSAPGLRLDSVGSAVTRYFSIDGYRIGQLVAPYADSRWHGYPDSRCDEPGGRRSHRTTAEIAKLWPADVRSNCCCDAAEAGSGQPMDRLSCRHQPGGIGLDNGIRPVFDTLFPDSQSPSPRRAPWLTTTLPVTA